MIEDPDLKFRIFREAAALDLCLLLDLVDGTDNIAEPLQVSPLTEVLLPPEFESVPRAATFAPLPRQRERRSYLEHPLEGRPDPLACDLVPTLPVGQRR